MVRTLPIRVEPVPGESLHSWLRALAHRTDVTWSDILHAVGLRGRRSYLYRSGWDAYLRPDERQRIAVAAALDPAQLDQLTLLRFSGIGVATTRASVIPRNVTMWRHHRGSRFCPHCLAESAGRWDLRWTLGWTFACPEHGCLLRDTCPGCGCANPSAQPRSVVPRPTRCMSWIADASPRRTCGADLTRSPVQALPNQHPFLDAQRTIVELTESGTTRPRAYGGQPVQVRTVLTDLSAIADYLIARHDVDAVERLLGAAGSAPPWEAQPAVAPRSRPPQRYRHPPATAREAAIGLTCGLQILSHDTVAAAGRHLACVVNPMPGSPPTRAWRVGQSAVFTAVQLRAAGPQLSPADQLRYRTGTDFPRRPHRPALVAANLDRRIPALMWPDWTRHLDPPTRFDAVARAALSCGVLVAGGVALCVAADILGHHEEKARITRQVDEFAAHDTWNELQGRIFRLADVLGANDPPVDYQRRRTLDYSGVLSDRQWTQLHRRIPGLDPSLAAQVRSELVTLLSGTPVPPATVISAGGEGIDPVVRSDPQFVTALDQIAASFLQSHGIDEPVSSCPPLPPEATIAGSD